MNSPTGWIPQVGFPRGEEAMGRPNLGVELDGSNVEIHLLLHSRFNVSKACWFRELSPSRHRR